MPRVGVVGGFRGEMGVGGGCGTSPEQLQLLPNVQRVRGQGRGVEEVEQTYLANGACGVSRHGLSKLVDIPIGFPSNQPSKGTLITDRPTET